MIRTCSLTALLVVPVALCGCTSGADSGAPQARRANADASEIATFSARIVRQLLRDDLGFDGLVFTDSMRMRAVTDMVSMARPLLADAEFVRKAAEGRADEINVCIACNQACLDHTFSMKTASCLLNPRACHETELNYIRAADSRKFAVVGSGPAGIAAALVQAGAEVHVLDVTPCDSRDVTFHRVDISDPADVNRVASALPRDICLLVNNAGGMVRGTFEQASVRPPSTRFSLDQRVWS